MRTLVFVAALVVAGLAAPAWATSPSGQQPPNVQGSWALKLVSVSTSDAPIIGDVTSQTVSYEKVTIDQSGTSLAIKEQLCDVDVASDQSAVTTTIPKRFVEHSGPWERPGKLTLEDGVWHLQIPKHYKFYGLKPSIGTRKLTHDKNSPYVYDQDEDGHLGMTIKLSGVLSGELYVIQRSWDEMNGKLYKSGQFAGPVDWRTDQIVLEKSGRIFGDMDPSKPLPKKSYFQLVRVDDSATCQDIVRKKNQLF